MNRIFILNNQNSPRLNSYLAAEIGLNESILLLQLEFWISISENEIDGRFWTYQSTSDMIQKSFPFWSQSTINRTINSLKSKNLVIVSRYNKVKYDKTRWFTLNYDEIEKLNSVTVKPFSESIPKQPDLPTAYPPVQISYPEPPPAPPAVPHPDQPDEISYRDIIEGSVMAKIPCENKVSAEDRAWLTDQVMAFDEDFVRQQIDYTNKKISKKGKEQPKIYFAYLRTRINQENFEKYSAAAGLIEKPKAVTTPLHNLKSGTVFEIIDTGERGKIDEQFGIMNKGTLLPIRVTELFNQGKLKIISEPKEVSQPKQFSRHDLPVFKSM